MNDAKQIIDAEAERTKSALINRLAEVKREVARIESEIADKGYADCSRIGGIEVHLAGYAVQVETHAVKLFDLLRCSALIESATR